VASCGSNLFAEIRHSWDRGQQEVPDPRLVFLAGRVDPATELLASRQTITLRMPSVWMRTRWVLNRSLNELMDQERALPHRSPTARRMRASGVRGLYKPLG
jgi:hypothetical protein